MSLNLEKELIEIIESDLWMIHVLKIVRDLKPNDSWVGAGFVRNKVWDVKHGKESTELRGCLNFVFGMFYRAFFCQTKVF